MQWIRIFHNDISKNLQFLQSCEGIREFVPNEDFPSFSSNEIYSFKKSETLNNEEYLVSLFGLNRPILDPYWELFRKILSTKEYLAKNSVLEALFPVLLRIVCHISYQSELVFNGFLLDPFNDTSVFLYSGLIIELLYSFPIKYTKELVNSMESFFECIQNLVLSSDLQTKNSAFRSITNHIYTVCYGVLLNSVISEDFLPLLNIVTSQFISFCSFIGNQQICRMDIERVLTCIRIFMRIPLSIIETFNERTFQQIMACCSLVINVSHFQTINEESKDIIYSLFENVIDLLCHFAKTSLKFKSTISEFDFPLMIGKFIIWSLDQNPIIGVGYDSNYHQSIDDTIPKELINSIRVPVIPCFQFIQTSTFSHPVKTNSQILEEYSKKKSSSQTENQFSLGFVESLFSEKPIIPFISQNTHLFSIITQLSTFFNLMDNTKFLHNFFLVIQDLIEGLNDLRTDLVSNFKVQEHSLMISFIFFIIELFCTLNPKYLSMVITINNGWGTIMHKKVFCASINLWKSNNEYANFILMLRNSIKHLIGMCFSANDPENEMLETSTKILSCIQNMLSSAQITIVDEFLPFLQNLFRANSSLFISSCENTGVIETILCHSSTLQVFHVNIKNSIDYHNLIPFIEQERLRLFQFLDCFLSDNKGKEFFFGSIIFVQFIFHYLFEEMMISYSCDIIKKGLMMISESISDYIPNNQLKNIFSCLNSILKEFEKNMSDHQWVLMMIKLFEAIYDSFLINRKTLIPYMQSQKTILFISNIPKLFVDTNANKFSNHFNHNEEENNLYYDLLYSVINLFAPLFRENAQFTKFVVSANDGYLNKVSGILSSICYGNKIINLLLSIVFEENITIESENTTLPIRNHDLLPFLLNSTMNLEVFSKVLKLLSSACYNSKFNILRVYQANIIPILLSYILRFPSMKDLPKHIIDSIEMSIQLFYKISVSVFSVPAFIKCIESMRIRDDGSRTWWTLRLLSLFSLISNEKSNEFPSSFFYLDGRHTGFDLPSFDSSLIKNGWTFAIRVEIDNMKSNQKSPPKLFMFYTSANYCFDSSIEQGRIALSVKFKGEIVWKQVIQEFVLIQNIWTFVIFSYYNKEISVYVNGILIKSYKNIPLVIDGTIEYASVANISSQSIHDNESPLVSSISCFYLFSQCIRKSVISDFGGLPLDFIFGFSPSERNINPDLPYYLFNEDIDSSLLIGVNARMIKDSSCLNISKKGIGNCKFRGSSFPFSASIFDTTAYFGGVMIFIPLFEQVNSFVYDDCNCSDNIQFLQEILVLFLHYFEKSSVFEIEFLKNDGFRVLSFCMHKVNPGYISENVILTLKSIFISLSEEESRIQMLKLVFFDFMLWKKVSQISQKFLYKTIFRDILSVYSTIFCSHITLSELLYEIYMQPVLLIRDEMWELYLQICSNNFPVIEQNRLFEFCVYSHKDEFQIEAINSLITLSETKIFNCHLVFARNRFYERFLPILASANELLRLKVLSLIINIYTIFKHDTIHQVIQQAIACYNWENSTEETWQFLFNSSFSNSKSSVCQNISLLVPFISTASHYFDYNLVLQYINQLDSIFHNDFPSTKVLNQCPHNYFWFFYIFLQGNNQIINDNSPIYNLFGYIMSSFLVYDQTGIKFSEMISFFDYLNETQLWNTRLIIKTILINCLKILPRNIPDVYLPICNEVFYYLFYISEMEPYFYNKQLLTIYSLEVPDSINYQLPKKISFNDYHLLFDKGINNTIKFQFNTRVTETGEWLDFDLCYALIEYLSDISTVFNLYNHSIPKQKFIYLFDVISYLFALLTIHKNESTVSLCRCFSKIFKEISFPQSSQSILIYMLIRLLVNDGINSIYSYIVEEPHMWEPTIPYGHIPDLTNPSFFNKIIRDGGLMLSQWLSYFLEFQYIVNENVNERICNFYSTFNSFFKHLNYRATDKPNETIENTIQLHKQKLKNEFGISAKVYSRMYKSIALNGGPWCYTQQSEHLKLANKTDKMFRHIFLKPNRHFDPHKSAIKEKKQGPVKIETRRNTIYQKSWDLNEEEIDEGILSQSERVSELQLPAKLITIYSVYEGTFYLTSNEGYFDGIQKNQEVNISIGGKSSKSVQFVIHDIVWVLFRSYLHINRGLEFFFLDGRSYFLFFEDNKGSDRKAVIRFLKTLKLKNIQILQDSDDTSFRLKYTDKWTNHQITTYEYLMCINLFSGRSFNDLSQYPVFPWIIKDYTSSELDLRNESTYRDLSKPIGALNHTRLSKLINDYEMCPECPAKCLYRCHYSTSYYVLHYLLRLEPYTTMHVQMQDGVFDHSNRLFNSIPKSFSACSDSINNDFRELIPEFFSLPGFLVNRDMFELGLPNSGSVELPAWASSSTDFIYSNRRALESFYVDENINYWIDLVFGIKQNGENAVLFNNTFHQYCYSQSIVNADPDTILQIQQHIGSFGIIPNQIFLESHPKRNNFEYEERLISQDPKLLFSINEPILCVTSHNDIICFITFSGRIGFQIIGNQSDPVVFYSIPYGIGDYYSVLLDQQILVVSSPSNDSFNIFTMKPITHKLSYRHKFSQISSISRTNNFLVVFSVDSTLTVWDLSLNNNFEPLYHINHHFDQAVDSNSSDVLGIIVSCDVSARFVICELQTGLMTLSFSFKSDTNPYKLMVIDDGFIAIWSKHIEPCLMKSMISIIGLNGDMIKQISYLNSIVSWTSISHNRIESFLVLGFDNGTISVLSIPHMKEMFSIKINAVPSNITYGSSQLIISSSNNQILSIPINEFYKS